MMQCSICRRKMDETEKPILYEVHDVLPDGELGTGFRVALCPPTLEGSNCEDLFRALAEKRGLALIPVEPDQK